MIVWYEEFPGMDDAILELLGLISAHLFGCSRQLHVNENMSMDHANVAQGFLNVCESIEISVWLRGQVTYMVVVLSESCFLAMSFSNRFHSLASSRSYGGSTSWWRHQMKHFPRYWPFVRRIHRSSVNSPHKGQWGGALMFTLICSWINGRVNNRKAGDLRCHHAHYDAIVMFLRVSGGAGYQPHCDLAICI